MVKLRGDFLFLSFSLIPLLSGCSVQIRDVSAPPSGGSTDEVVTESGVFAFEFSGSGLVGGASGQQVYAKNILTGEISVVSSDASGVPDADDASYEPALINGAGTMVVFQSETESLPENNGGDEVIYRKNLVTGEIENLCKNSSGILANESCRIVSYSNDGRYLMFGSEATNLVSGVTDGNEHIYIKDLTTGVIKVTPSSGFATITRDATWFGFEYDSQFLLLNLVTSVSTMISKNQFGFESDEGIDNDAFYLSPNGKHAAFVTDSGNLLFSAGSGDRHVYLRDLVTNELSIAAINNSGDVADDDTEFEDNIGFSANSQYLFFKSEAGNLVTGAQNYHMVYRKDLLTGELKAGVTDASGDPPNDSFWDVKASPTGKYVVFTSCATNLVGGVTSRQVFIKNVDTGEVELLSTDSDGDQATSSPCAA